MQSTDVQARRRVLGRREELVRLPMALAGDAAGEALAPVRSCTVQIMIIRTPRIINGGKGISPNIAKTNNAVSAFRRSMSNTARTSST